MVGRFTIGCIGRSLKPNGRPVQGILPSLIVGVLKDGETIDDFKVRVQQQQQQQDAAGGGADDDEVRRPPQKRSALQQQSGGEREDRGVVLGTNPK